MRMMVTPFWLILGILAFIIASSKGRSGCGWFFIGIFLGPIGILIALLMPNLNHQRYQRPQQPRRPPQQNRQNHSHQDVQTIEYKEHSSNDINVNQQPHNHVQQHHQDEEQITMKMCPYCFEYIKSEAKVCKHCKSKLY